MAMLRQFFLGSRRRRILTGVGAVVIAAGLAALIGAGSSSTTVTAPQVQSNAAPAESTETSCTSGLAGHNVRVTFYGEGEAACTRFDQEASASSGEYWRLAQFPPASAEEELVCSMAKGSSLIEVRDTGEHDYGNRICAGLTAKGWHETEGPGEKLERSRKAHEAEEKAKAEQQAERERAAEARKREAEQRQTEAREHKEIAEQERENREQDRKNEEETKKIERESEALAH